MKTLDVPPARVGTMGSARRGSGAHAWGMALLLAVLAGCGTPYGATRLSGGTLRPFPPGCAESLLVAPLGHVFPGRNPDSKVPWDFFLGHAAHRIIGYKYRSHFPDHNVYYNTSTLKQILQREKIGNPSLLLSDEKDYKPDIADISIRNLLEIKPWNEDDRQKGRAQVDKYLTAINRSVPPGDEFSAGTNFHGAMLIRFAQGHHIWRLEWCTTEPGIVQYHWIRSKERFDSEAKALEAGEWVVVSVSDMVTFGGWVASATEILITDRELIADVSDAFSLVIDSFGQISIVTLSGRTLRRSTPPSTGNPPMSPPPQDGAKIIPFPPRAPPAPPPAQIPAAASSGR